MNINQDSNVFSLVHRMQQQQKKQHRLRYLLMNFLPLFLYDFNEKKGMSAIERERNVQAKGCAVQCKSLDQRHKRAQFNEREDAEKGFFRNSILAA